MLNKLHHKPSINTRKAACPLGMTKIDDLIQLLQDGKWHGLDQITKALETPLNQLREVVQSLEKHDLIQRNNEKNEIKLNHAWKTLLIEDDSKENVSQEKVAVGTLIVPPYKSILIQYTNITNLTDASLEVAVRIDNRLCEIAINRIGEN